MSIAGCDGSGCDGELPDIVLIVVDTLRADHLGLYGYDRATSPVLDALAAESTIFGNATAPSSWTLPSMASLFTGRLPADHGVRRTRNVLPDALPTIAERLRGRGYRTVGLTANFVHVTRRSGFARGFDTFRSVSLRASESRQAFLSLGAGKRKVGLRPPTAGELNDRVFAALEALEDPDSQPLFLYVHYMDPHSGYMPPAAHARLFEADRSGPEATSDYVVELAAGRLPADGAERDRLVDLYDGEISYVDAEIGRLLAGLEERGLLQEAVIVVVSDHGEEFLDHDGWFHGLTLHREQLHVPLVVQDRRCAAAPVRRDEPVDLLDVSATLLTLAGLEPDPLAPGRNLLGQEPLRPRPRVAELSPDPLHEKRMGPVRHLLAVTEWPWKALIDAHGGMEFYELGSDPHELSPLPGEHSRVPASLAALAVTIATNVDSGDVSRDEPKITLETREALRALGYAE